MYIYVEGFEGKNWEIFTKQTTIFVPVYVEIKRASCLSFEIAFIIKNYAAAFKKLINFMS